MMTSCWKEMTRSRQKTKRASQHPLIVNRVIVNCKATCSYTTVFTEEVRVMAIFMGFVTVAICMGCIQR